MKLKRSNAPVFWLLFGAGGMLSALLGSALGLWLAGALARAVTSMVYDTVDRLIVSIHAPASEATRRSDPGDGGVAIDAMRRHVRRQSFFTQPYGKGHPFGRRHRREHRHLLEWHGEGGDHAHHRELGAPVGQTLHGASTGDDLDDALARIASDRLNREVAIQGDPRGDRETSRSDHHGHTSVASRLAVGRIAARSLLGACDVRLDRDDRQPGIGDERHPGARVERRARDFEDGRTATRSDRVCARSAALPRGRAAPGGPTGGVDSGRVLGQSEA